MENRVYFDGENWVHLSDDFCFIYPERMHDFIAACNWHIDLFTKNYYPKAGDIVFDVGSWNGAELPIWSRAVGDSGHVYAIEPDPKFHEQGLKVVELLGLKNVTCINAGLMDTVGLVEMGKPSEVGIGTSIKADDAVEKFTVNSTTIDQIMNDYGIDQIDYIKMNIEGAEEFAIQGLTDFSKVKNWCISTHDFCGIPTKDFVIKFLSDKLLKIVIHEEVPDQQHKGGYLYVTNN